MPPPLELISFGIGLLTFAFMIFDCVWLESHFCPRAYQPVLLKLVLLPGLFALFNGCSAVLPRSEAFLSDIGTVCRVCWIFYYLQSYLVNFDPNGFGGAAASRYYAGETLNHAQFPADAAEVLPLPIRLMGIKYPLNSAWLSACIARIKFFLFIRIVLVVVRQIASDYDMLYESNGAPKVTELCFRFASIFVTLVGVSGFIPANYVFYRIVTPERRELLSLRQKTFWLFMPIMSAFQSLVFILLSNNITPAIERLIIAVEMVLVQYLCHKCFVPFFGWSIPAPVLTKEDLQEVMRSGFLFSVPIEDMVDALAGKDVHQYSTVDFSRFSTSRKSAHNFSTVTPTHADLKLAMN